MTTDTSDRAVLVTGCARGIGRSTAQGLAALGFAVYCTDIDAAGLAETVAVIEDAGGAVAAAPADLTEEVAVERLVGQAEAEWGGLHGLVHVAGGTAATRVPLLELDRATFQSMLDRNLVATFLVATACARRMRGRGGSLVLTSSIAAELAFPGLAHYGAAKGGVKQLMKCLALELAEHDIRVNAVAPGSVLTPGNSRFMDATPAARTWVARTPAGRLGSAEEIVGAVAYLLSPSAGYTTGSTITIDGGYSVA